MEHRAYRVGRDVPRQRIDVAEHRTRARVDDRLGRRVEGEGRHDDLVAGLDAERPEPDGDGVRAVGNADRVTDAQVVGQLALERLAPRARE